jgi:hypothetical protein
MNLDQRLITQPGFSGAAMWHSRCVDRSSSCFPVWPLGDDQGRLGLADLLLRCFRLGVLSQGDHILPIPGTKRRKYLEDNLGALNVTLTAEELREINAACPPELVLGNRNAAASMKAMNL